MARIRTIKPEFWTSEQVMEITPLARLAFIAMWNFSDDHGVHPASYKTLRAEAFAGDDNITADTVVGLVAEMQRERLVAEFEVDGKRYWHVTGWARHQKIDKPTYRHPEPPSETTCRREVTEHSASTPRDLVEPSPTESKGVERKGSTHTPRVTCDESDGDFSAFWEQYPKKVAKHHALKAWKKVKPFGQLLADLMAGLEHQKESSDWQKDGGQFIPYPSTWLNQRRWEDEPARTADQATVVVCPPKPGDTRIRLGAPEVFTETMGWIPEVTA